MPEPIRWQTKLMLFKLEASYGVDPVPTGADDGVLATDVSLSPMQGSDVERDLETPYLGANPVLPAELHRTLSFKIELQGSGTVGTAPEWGKLLRACACAETIVPATSVTYNPISDSHESGTFYFWVGSTLYKLGGARGTVALEYSAQGIPYLKFTFTGLYSPATETARVTPDLTAYEKPKLVTDANTPVFTVNGVSLVMRSAVLDLGNQVEPRFLVGAEAIIITDRKDAFSATVEAVPLTTLDPMALALAQTEVAVALTHGTGAGSIAALSIPAAQFARLDGFEINQNIVEWPLRLTPLAQSGNDQWTLTLT